MEDALLLARAQFGLNIGFHILFPTLTIGLAWFLLGFRLQYQPVHGSAFKRTTSEPFNLDTTCSL